MKEFWNQRYAEAGYVYGREPNAYIRRFIDDHEAGSILFPAEGEGRNAVYAAAKGWRVTAFDYSESAREKALALAVGAGLEIDYHLADAGEFPFPTGAYDAVGLCFVHLPPSLRPVFHRNIIDALKKTGTVVMEAFSKDQIKYRSGGPKDEKMLFDVDQVKKEFSELDIIYLNQEVVILDEGPYHQGEASVIRMIGRRID